MLTIHRSLGCTVSALRWAWYVYVKNVFQHQKVSDYWGGTAEAMAAAEMVIGSSGTTTGIEVIELIDSKSMTAAMETANKVVSAYQAPN